MKITYLAISLVLLFSLVTFVNCGTKAQWKQRTIYQLLTDRFSRTDGSTQPCANLGDYCGGTFQGIINNLDYITGMGFDAIWISPIVLNTPGGYHGYWAQDWYQVNPNFGTQQDLLNLIQACHNAGVWVMFDVVQNHVGPVGFDYESINPFNQGSNYHPYCVIQDSDWNNNQTAVEWCRLAGLPDLYQEDPATRSALLNWVQYIKNTYNPDGIRLDTVPEVHPDYWAAYAQQAGVFTIGEVFNGNPSYVASYQAPSGPLDSTLNYPLFYQIRNAFQSGQSMYTFRSYYSSMSVFGDQTVLGNFVDNHDNARFLYGNGNQPAFVAALAFSLTATGIPIVYYGDEQAYGGGPDPGCREQLWTNMNTSFYIYQKLASIVAVRKQYQIWNLDQTERYVNNNLYAFSRGQVFIALTNSYNTVNVTITYHPYSNGQRICNIFYPAQDCLTITNNQFQLVMLSGETKIFVPSNSLDGLDLTQNQYYVEEVQAQNSFNAKRNTYGFLSNQSNQ